jgi:hypothetical protein
MMSIMALAFTQFPLQWIPEAIFPKIQQLVCEDDQLLLPSTKFMLYFWFSHYVVLHHQNVCAFDCMYSKT